MARKKSTNWISYQEAVDLVRSEGLGSRQQYLDWWDSNKPRRLSKYPHRIYSEWTSWNDFLGTNNTFNQGKKATRPYGEAVLWVHKQGIEGGRAGWLAWLEQHGEDLPEDIPTRPDFKYKKDWVSWKHWLGDHVVEKVEAQQKAVVDNSIYYIIREQDYSHVSNVYTFGLEKGGISALKERWQTEKFSVVKLYKFDARQIDSIKKIVEECSKPYYDGTNTRMVTNIHNLCWELINVLEPVQ